MKILTVIFLLCTGLIINRWFIWAGDTRPTGRDIMLKVEERPDGDDRVDIIKMTLIDKRGRQRNRTVSLYEKEYGKDSKTLIYFKSPADIKGTGFLSYDYHEPGKKEEKWLYLPALRKSRRISGANKDNYFMGTDFTYDDLGDRSVDEDKHRYLREEENDSHKYWVVESVPNDPGYIYSKKISWIRQDSLIPTKIEFYDRKGMLLKHLTVRRQEKKQGIWTIVEVEMNNIQKKHKTLLEWVEVRYNQNIEDRIFNVAVLERGELD